MGGVETIVTRLSASCETESQSIDARPLAVGWQDQMANLVACVADWLTKADVLGVEGAPHLNRRHVIATRLPLAGGDKRSRPAQRDQTAGPVGVQHPSSSSRCRRHGASLPRITMRVRSPA